MGEEPEAAVQAVLPLIEKLPSPSFFAHNPCGFFLHDGAVLITFEVGHFDITAPQGQNLSRVVAGRVHMPLGGAQRLALSLYDFLKNSGFDPSAIIQTAGDPSKPQ